MNTKTFWACGLLAAGLLSSGPLLAQIAPAADTAAPAPDVQAQIDAAMAAETRGRYSAALSLWQPLADSGLAEAQYRIGRIYAWGLGVCKNETAAADWLTRAAGQGHILAQQQLGYLYLAQGQASFAKAKSWFLKAAQAGDAESQYRLGPLVTGDKPTPAQYREAAAWYEKGALQGHIPAMMELCRLNRDGLGVV
ncbi:MAG: sel1 repeat family protein, partial [Asticcacaulis sp.]|nr:sel1 repeat family protein [Asticcacaulis sp.]